MMLKRLGANPTKKQRKRRARHFIPCQLIATRRGVLDGGATSTQPLARCF